MRIIKISTIRLYYKREPMAEQPLLSWIQEIENAQWQNHNELKKQYQNASIINHKRVVFNIHGNRYRLVASLSYKFQIAYVIWIGTHAEYDKINVETIKYVKTNKN